MTTITTLSVAYFVQKYSSFLRTGLAYRAIISRHAQMTNLSGADIVFMHGDLAQITEWFLLNPTVTSKYLIGYIVWEADPFPEAALSVLRLFDEVWTCSAYCYNIISRSHPRVMVIPHVVSRDVRCSRATIDSVKDWISYDSDRTYFLTIGRLSDPRKNTAQLIEAFNTVAEDEPNIRLVLKCFAHESGHFDSLRGNPRIIVLASDLESGQVNALFSVADVYISLHHAEAWGLSLSDAMLFTKPVVATGYSGNLAFMDHTTSFLVDSTIAHIRPPDCSSLFNADMQWANPDAESAIKAIRYLAGNHKSMNVQAVAARGSERMREYSEHAVSVLIRDALQACCDRFVPDRILKSTW